MFKCKLLYNSVTPSHSFDFLFSLYLMTIRLQIITCTLNASAPVVTVVAISANAQSIEEKKQRTETKHQNKAESFCHSRGKKTVSAGELCVASRDSFSARLFSLNYLCCGLLCYFTTSVNVWQSDTISWRGLLPSAPITHFTLSALF